jgi:hypothetical protein
VKDTQGNSRGTPERCRTEYLETRAPSTTCLMTKHSSGQVYMATLCTFQSPPYALCSLLHLLASESSLPSDVEHLAKTCSLSARISRRFNIANQHILNHWTNPHLHWSTFLYHEHENSHLPTALVSFNNLGYLRMPPNHSHSVVLSILDAAAYHAV